MHMPQPLRHSQIARLDAIGDLVAQTKHKCNMSRMYDSGDVLITVFEKFGYCNLKCKVFDIHIINTINLCLIYTFCNGYVFLKKMG